MLAGDMQAMTDVSSFTQRGGAIRLPWRGQCGLLC
jgi:hypothetical protein